MADEQQRPASRNSRLTPAQLIEATRGVLSAVRNGVGPIAVVVNNNQRGNEHIIETAPNVTLDVGTKLYAAPVSEPPAASRSDADVTEALEFLKNHGSATLHVGAFKIERLLASTLSERPLIPDGWKLVCEKCGADSESACGWPTNCIAKHPKSSERPGQ